MKCPFCNSEDTKVIDSRTSPDGSTKRRRECSECLKDLVLMKDLKKIKYML